MGRSRLQLEDNPCFKRSSAVRSQKVCLWWPSMTFHSCLTGLSRTSSTSYDSRRSVKRAGSLRFSSVSNSLSNTRAATAMSERTLYGVQEQNEGQSVQVETPARDLEPDSSVSPNGSREVSIHMQIIHGGVIVHDASGRQRMLQMNEITQLLSQLKDELAAAPTWGEIVAVRLRAESALRIGNLKSATVDLQGALRMLQDSPSLGVDKISRAAMLYSLGQAYQNLDMLTEAESCYLESLGLYKRSLGRDHHKNFAILQNLGDVCQKRGHTIEATCLYERAFTGRLKMLGQNDPDTLSSMQELALLKSSLGHSESALFLLENAVPALESVFGLQNEKTLTAMDKLSLLYQKLGHEPEAHDICSRAIPPCKTFFGVDGTMTRELVVRYFQTSGNFDFPAEVKDIIDQYRQSRNPDSLRVVHRLARSYMDGGLNRDASELFQSLYEDFLVVKGPDAPETFDALSALCVSREHLDGIEQAIHAYSNLITLASKTPEGHHSRKRVGYAEKRIKELNRRRDILAAERKDWGLQEPGECINCGSSTTDLCSSKTFHPPPPNQGVNGYGLTPTSMQNRPLLQRILPQARPPMPSSILPPQRLTPRIEIPRRKTQMRDPDPRRSSWAHPISVSVLISASN